MPVATYEQYCKMMDTAYANHYAFPAINVFDMESINGVLAGLAEAHSDGIIQMSFGGAQHASGTLKDMYLGALALANHVHLMAEKYNIFVALHTDHCQNDKVDTFMIPLIEETERRRAAGLPNLFNSHMFDGSALPHKENVKIAKGLLERCAKSQLVLEVEAGVVGGEEDGVTGEAGAKLYTTPEDMLLVENELSGIGRYTLAATFGNVHGSYKPGVVKLRPSLLGDIQARVARAVAEGELPSAAGIVDFPNGKPFELVFHGGSGSRPEEIAEAVSYGVIKMNIDTDTQYAFTRPIADHVFENYDKVLKIDGEVGEKKFYDPRSWGRKAEDSMSARVVEACRQLGSAGKALK